MNGISKLSLLKPHPAVRFSKSSGAMFAVRGIALVLSLVVAAGRRHTESLGLAPEDVVEAEEKAVEALESISPPAGSDDEKLIPLAASFQVASTMDEMPVKTKFVLSVTHEPKPSEKTLGVHIQFTAKHEASATAFASDVQSLYTMAVAMFAADSSVTMKCSSKGRQVNLDILDIPWIHRPVYDNRSQSEIDAAHASVEEKWKRAIASIGHVNVSFESNSDMMEIMAHLSNETVLYEEAYKGFRYSFDVTLTRALEKMILSKLPSDPSQAGSPVAPAAIIQKLFSLLTGASADVKVGFDESVRQELIRSAPIINMTYGTLVTMYRPIVASFPPPLRGSPFAHKWLDVINDLESIETMDTIELSGLPDVKIMAVDNTTAGAFEFVAKLVKDAGIEAVLQNTAPLPPPPQHDEAAIQNFIKNTPIAD